MLRETSPRRPRKVTVRYERLEGPVVPDGRDTRASSLDAEPTLGSRTRLGLASVTWSPVAASLQHPMNWNGRGRT